MPRPAKRTAKRKGNVVSLHGTALPIPKRNADVIAQLKEFTDAAQSGQIAGFVYGVVTPEGYFKVGWCGNADKHQMISVSAILSNRLCRVADGDV